MYRMNKDYPTQATKANSATSNLPILHGVEVQVGHTLAQPAERLHRQGIRRGRVHRRYRRLQLSRRRNGTKFRRDGTRHSTRSLIAGQRVGLFEVYRHLLRLVQIHRPAVAVVQAADPASDRAVQWRLSDAQTQVVVGDVDIAVAVDVDHVAVLPQMVRRNAGDAQLQPGVDVFGFRDRIVPALGFGTLQREGGHHHREFVQVATVQRLLLDLHRQPVRHVGLADDLEWK